MALDSVMILCKVTNGKQIEKFKIMMLVGHFSKVMLAFDRQSLKLLDFCENSLNSLIVQQIDQKFIVFSKNSVNCSLRYS